MTDNEIARYCGIADDDPDRAALLAHVLKKRETIEAMAQLEGEISLWQAGLGPRPTNAIICGKPHPHKEIVIERRPKRSRFNRV